MSEQGDRFSCNSCNRSYIWKAALAGKRVKCKCGQMIQVPDQTRAAIEPEDDALYEMADMEARAAAHLPPMVMAAAPVVPAGAAAMAVGRATAGGIPLAYKRGPSMKDRERASTNVLIDMNRDVYVPAGLLVGGLLIYVAYYAVNYHLSGSGIVLTMLGLSIVTALKAGILIGFALVAAGPLGVSFGGLFTAALKLAATAVFCDGVVTWLGNFVAHYAAGFGAEIIGFPISIAIYWTLFIYLFSMDPGDSWMVVTILCVLDCLLRWVLLALLLSAILSWGGAAPSALASLGGGGGGSSTSSQSSATEEHVTSLKDSGGLRDARQYITDGHQASLGPFVESCYAAGAKSASFEIERDINRKTTPYALAIELPSDKSKRAQVYAAVKRHYDEAKIEYDAEDLKDDGGRYVEVELK